MFRATPGDILPGQTLLQIATPKRWSEAEGPMPPAGRGSAQHGRLAGELFADRSIEDPVQLLSMPSVPVKEWVSRAASGEDWQLVTSHYARADNCRCLGPLHPSTARDGDQQPACPSPRSRGPSPRIRKRSSFAGQCCDWLPAKRKSLQTGHWTCQTRAIRAPPRAARDSRC